MVLRRYERNFELTAIQKIKSNKIYAQLFWATLITFTFIWLFSNFIEPIRAIKSTAIKTLLTSKHRWIFHDFWWITLQRHPDAQNNFKVMISNAIKLSINGSELTYIEVSIVLSCRFDTILYLLTFSLQQIKNIESINRINEFSQNILRAFLSLSLYWIRIKRVWSQSNGNVHTCNAVARISKHLSNRNVFVLFYWYFFIKKKEIIEWTYARDIENVLWTFFSIQFR